MVLVFVFVKKIVQKWFIDGEELSNHEIARAATGQERSVDGLPSSFARSEEARSSSEERISLWVDRTSAWIKSWSTYDRAWAPESGASKNLSQKASEAEGREMDRKLKWMQSEYNRLEIALELKSKMINERTEQIDGSEQTMAKLLADQKLESAKLEEEIQAKQVKLKEDFNTTREQNQTLLEQEMKDRRDELLGELHLQIEKERYELRKSLSEEQHQKRDSSDFVTQIDDKLQNELENIGRVFTGLANEQMSFNEKDLKILLQNSYFNIMSSAQGDEHHQQERGVS